MKAQKLTKYIKFAAFIILFFSGIAHFSHDQYYHYIFGYMAGSETADMVNFFIGFSLIFASLLVFNNENSPLYYCKSSCIFFGSIFLLLNTIGAFIGKGLVFEQIIEHAIQIGVPILYLRQKKFGQTGKTILVLKVLIALTFLGHGLFALGFHFVPGSFIEMTMKAFNTSYENALIFLTIVGVLDIIVAVGIFIPKIDGIMLSYAFVWGLITAVARVYSYMHDLPISELLISNAPNMLWRLAHGIIPLATLIYLSEPKR